MATKALPSPEVLRQLLRYEPDTGKLFWRHRGPEWFAPSGRGGASGAAARWNAVFADREAFTSDDGRGYRVGAILGVKAIAHRAIWAMQTGSWPLALVDHANGTRCDNRWSNLRAADYATNGANRKSAKGSSSRYLGVGVVVPGRKWRSYIAIGGRSVHLGYFADEAEAAIAYDKAAVAEYGDFARPNFRAHAAALADTPDEAVLRAGDLVIRQRDAACP